MSTNASHPVKSLSPAHQARIAKVREKVAAELPGLIVRERRMREAAEENTLSGELRRTIHSGDRDLIALVCDAGRARRASTRPWCS